jgi:hypothetical protein
MRAMEKRKSGMRRMENTQKGSSPASSTKTRYHEAAPREENIVKNRCQL